MASGAIIDVAALTECVDRLCELQPVDVPGLSEELDDQVHELITTVFSALGSVRGASYLRATVGQRAFIQSEFDTIDQAVTIVE